eukprot:s933_g10.t1
MGRSSPCSTASPTPTTSNLGQRKTDATRWTGGWGADSLPAVSRDESSVTLIYRFTATAGSGAMFDAYPRQRISYSKVALPLSLVALLCLVLYAVFESAGLDDARPDSEDPSMKRMRPFLSSQSFEIGLWTRQKGSSPSPSSASARSSSPEVEELRQELEKARVRLAGLVRGPLLPPEIEVEVLSALRSWVAHLQDLGELHRGVVPSPVGVAGGVGVTGRFTAVPPPPPPGQPGLTAKASAPVPAEPDRRSRTEVKAERREKEAPPDTGEGEGGPASSHRTSPVRESKRRRSSSSHRRVPKSSRKSRSGRRREPSREHRPPRRERLASPVRPAGVKREASPSESDRRRPRQHRERPEPSHRPEGPAWTGPILARRPEPAPGTGRHFQKNKGKKKRQKNYNQGGEERPPRCRRRPAGAEEAPVVEVDAELDCAALTVAQCQELRDVEVTEGTYWSEKVTAALRVKEVRIKEDGLRMSCQVLGTQSEALLRAASGLEGSLMEAHLCPAECTGEPHAENLLHVRKMRILGAHREAWMSNLLGGDRPPAGEDELAELRRDKEQLKKPEAAVREAGRGSYSPSPLREGDQKKEKRRRRSKKKKKRRTEFKVEGVKEVKALFKDTGLDPDAGVRKRFRKRAAKMAKRKKEGRSTGSSSSSRETSSSMAGGDHTLFGSSSKIQKVGRHYPGALCAAALEEASETLVNQEGGIWSLQESLPPLFVRYYRAQLANKMSAPMAREAHTVSYALDLLLRGRPAEVADLLGQRLKSLEMVANGVHYTVSQQQELLVRDTASMSSVQEFQEASRLAREEGKAKLEAARPYGSRNTGTPRTEEWTRPGGKKGGGKGKTGKQSDQKKGEGEKGGKEKAKGS